MSNANSEVCVEVLAPEPCIPRRSLACYKDGRELLNWEIKEKKLQLRKAEAPLTLLLTSWEQQDANDLTLCLGTERCSCNRLRCYCYSPYVLHEWKLGQRELLLPEQRLTMRGLQLVAAWMLQPNAPLQREHILELLAAAHVLQLEYLVAKIWFCLDTPQQFEEEQAFWISCEARRLAHTLPNPGLHLAMLQHIRYFFLTLVASKQYVELPLEQVQQLLGSEHIKVNSEQEIFFAAVRWLNHNWQARLVHALALLQKLHLDLLPYKLLKNLQRGTVESQLKPLTELPELKQSIKQICQLNKVLLFDDGSQALSQALA
ncbi:CG12862 [Drosophila busckii]|uniref:CG12862 n=1 Tax=Drosophila busckii TaxID=30019 RepID=A0A0M4E5W2_DROBS|nr:CG12862 [Drosophila busckii]